MYLGRPPPEVSALRIDCRLARAGARRPQPPAGLELGIALAIDLRHLLSGFRGVKFYGVSFVIEPPDKTVDHP